MRLEAARIPNSNVPTFALSMRVACADYKLRDRIYSDLLTASGEIFRGLGAARCPAAV
jgi:hypothetical protein